MIAAGIISCRDTVAGSDSTANEPPFPGPKQKSAELRREHGSPELGRAEHRDTRLEHQHAGERGEQRRLVADDLLGIEAREPGDEREEAVPERERVARDAGRRP